jgi:hypothetical protein
MDSMAIKTFREPFRIKASSAICVWRTSSRLLGELCENITRLPARDNRIPSRALAWMSSSYTIKSPGWGMQEKTPTLASKPELNKSPLGALWNSAMKFSSSSA